MAIYVEASGVLLAPDGVVVHVGLGLGPDTLEAGFSWFRGRRRRCTSCGDRGVDFPGCRQLQAGALAEHLRAVATVVPRGGPADL
ncbi:MAG: hypothetical protein ACXWVT_08525, partial [Burkholderiaceae bacterium]